MGRVEKIVVLDVVEPDHQPSYLIAGKCTCIACDEWCWLGMNSFTAVQSGEVKPLCQPCATKYVDDKSEHVGNINDPIGEQ